MIKQTAANWTKQVRLQNVSNLHLLTVRIQQQIITQDTQYLLLRISFPALYFSSRWASGWILPLSFIELKRLFSNLVHSFCNFTAIFLRSVCAIKTVPWNRLSLLRSSSATLARFFPFLTYAIWASRFLCVDQKERPSVVYFLSPNIQFNLRHIEFFPQSHWNDLLQKQKIVWKGKQKAYTTTFPFSVR